MMLVYGVLDRITCYSFAFALLFPSIDVAKNGGIMTQVLDNLRCPYQGRISFKDFELLCTRFRTKEFK